MALTVADKTVEDGPGDSKIVRYNLKDEDGNVVASYETHVGPHDAVTQDAAIEAAIQAEKARVEAL